MRKVPWLVLAVLGIARAASEEPPTDAQVQALIAAHGEAVRRLDDAGRLTPEALERLRSEALGRLGVSSMNPGQIALLHGARLLPFGARRDQALERLEGCRKEPGPTGAAAAVLRLELLGNPYAWQEGTERRRYVPEPALQATLLDEVLRHPDLEEAVRRGDPAAVMVLSSIGGMRTASLWRTHRKELLGLRRLYTETVHPRLWRDASDFLDVLAAIAPEEVEPVRERILALGRDRLKGGAGLAAADRKELESVLARLGGAAARGKLLGNPAPPLEITWSSDGKLRALSDLEGKVVVLDFWATTCGPCVASLPEVRRLAERYEGFALAIVGVTSIQGIHVSPQGRVDCAGDPRREMELMKEYRTQKGITWTVVFTRQDVYNPDYGIQGIPHVVILDPKGKVRFRGLHPADPLADKAAKIDGLLREAGLEAPPAPATGR